MILADDQRYASTERLIWNFLKKGCVYPAEIVPTPDQLTMSISIKLGFSPIRMLESDFLTILSNSVRGHMDGHKAYREAVEDAFGADVDYAAAKDLRSFAGD